MNAELTGGNGGVTRMPKADCGFPTCDERAVTDTGMCELHRRVHVSTTGSWLEAG